MAGKRRRIKFHKRLSLLVALVLSLVIAFLLLKKSNVLTYRLSKYVNEHYLKGTAFRFACGEVSGDLLNHVTVKDVVLRYEDEGKRFDLFRAGRVEIDYSIVEVLKLNLVIDNLMLENATVRLEQGRDGKLLLPFSPGQQKAITPGIYPFIDLKNFTIEDFNFVFRDSSRTVAINDVNLAGKFHLENGAGVLEIENSSAYIPGTGTALHSLRLKTSFSSNFISIDDFIARLDRSYIMLTGRYESGEAKHLQFVFNPLDLQEISSLGIIPRNEGEIGGSITISGKADELNLRGSVTGKALGLVFSGFSFEGIKAGREIVLSHLEGKVFGSYIMGKMRYLFGSDGGYTFTGSCRGLDISEGFLPGEDTPETDLFGRIHVDYNRKADKYVIRADLDSSTVQGFKSRQVRVEACWTGVGGLTLENAEFSNPGFTLSGSGTIDIKAQADLIFSLKGHDLSYLWDYLSLPRIRGSASLSGRAAGPVDNLQINLNGNLRDASFLFASVDSGVVQAEIKNVPSEKAVATVDLRGSRINLAGKAFSSPHILLKASEGMLKFKDFSFSKGDTLITADFDFIPAGPGGEILFKHIIIKLPGEIWASKEAATMMLHEGTLSVDSILLASRNGEFRLSGEYDSSKKKFNLSASGREVESSVIQRSLGLPWKLLGKCRFLAEAKGTLEDPSLRISFHLGEGVIGNINIESMDFEGEYANEAYTLNRVFVKDRSDSLWASGWWQLSESPVRLAKKLVSRGKITNSSWLFDIDAYHFPLSKVFRALEKKAPLHSAFTGSVLLSGSPAHARLQADVRLSATDESRFIIPDVDLVLDYGNGILQVKSLSFDDGKVKGKIEGSIPLALDLTHGLRLRGEAPVELDASISSGDLGALSDYLREISLAKGKLNSRIAVRGSLQNPQFSGNIEFSDMELHLTGMEETYSAVDGKVVLLGNLVQLASLSGKVGKKGSFYGSGFAELEGFKPSRYRIDIYFKDFLFASIHDFLSLQDGNITLASLGEGERKLTPVITGSMKVKQATITRSIAGDEGEQPPLAMPTDNPAWFCNLELDAPKNIQVKSPGLNMELGGNIILKRDRSGLYLRGELNVLRGSYTLYNNKFKIMDGVFDFSAATAFRPEININAYNVYRQGEEEHRVFLNLSWPKDKKEPIVTLSSDEPQYSETDIWKMLGGTYVSTGSDNDESSSWDATGTAQNLATNYFETILNAQMKDITIDVESRTLGKTGRDQRPEREMTIAIGKYLSEDLYLKYRQGLSIATEREVDIEYRIGNMLILRSEIIRHSPKRLLGKSSQATDEINFDIKFRFEY